MQDWHEFNRYEEWAIVDRSDSEVLFREEADYEWDYMRELFLSLIWDKELSDWEDRAFFGQVTDAHSDLVLCEIAVFLGYDSPIEMYPDAPEYEPKSGEFTISFTGPDGRALEVRRTIGDEV